jgi:hypothetical protein
METDLVAYRWLGLVNAMDASGRRLSEGSGPPEVQPMSDMEYVACPYSDTRSLADKPMNRSALVSITTCWDRICDWTHAVTTAYQKRQPIAEFRFLDVWRIAAVLRTAPFFVLLRRSGEANRQFSAIPEWLAGAYKAARGVEDAILHMACVGMDLRRTYSFDSLYDFVCKHRLFEGSAEVCAGSPALIKAFLEQLTPASVKSSAGRSDVMLHPIASEPVLHQLLDYAACETLVESLSTMYEVGRFRCLDLRRGLDSSEPPSEESRKDVDQGKYPLSGLARAMTKNYAAANERLLRGYLQLAFPENASSCMALLDEPLVSDFALAHAVDENQLEEIGASYLHRVSDELFKAEQRIRTILGIEPLEAFPSDDYLEAIFGPSR